jgi:hypothetical protein
VTLPPIRFDVRTDQYLRECRGALDRGRIDALRGVNVVGAVVRCDLAFVGGAAGGVVGDVGLDNVVFDEGVGGPAVDGEVGVAVGGEGTGVVYCSDGGGLVVVGGREGRRRGFEDGDYRALPGFQPLPATKLPTLLHEHE